MTRRHWTSGRWSMVAICLGVVLLMGSAAFRVAGVPALVRFPLDVNKTAHYTGTSTTYIDQNTLLPLATPKVEPLQLDRHVKVVNGSFGRAVVAETVTIRTPSSTNVETYRYVMDRRTMKFVSDPGQYAFGDPKSTMHAAGSFRVNFAMGTTPGGTYRAYIPEADSQVPLRLVRGPFYDPKTGTDVVEFSSKLETPVAPYYRTHLAAIGLPMQVTAAELQPQLMAAGIDMGRALADVGSRLTPADAALLSSTLAKPVPLRYFFVVDGNVFIEPKTGALVDVHSNQEGVAVQPDLSGAAALKPVLDRYSDIPSVKAVSDGLAKLALQTPQLAQTLKYQQTPASSAAIAATAASQARMMTVVTWWVPGLMAAFGAALVLLGVIRRRRNRRGGPNRPAELPVPEPSPAPVPPVPVAVGPAPGDRIPADAGRTHERV
jgi:hypothetical protein